MKCVVRVHAPYSDLYSCTYKDVYTHTISPPVTCVDVLPVAYVVLLILLPVAYVNFATRHMLILLQITTFVYNATANIVSVAGSNMC